MAERRSGRTDYGGPPARLGPVACPGPTAAPVPTALLALLAALTGCALATSPADGLAGALPVAALPADTSASPVPTSSRQMLLVTTDGWEATSGRLQRYVRVPEREETFAADPRDPRVLSRLVPARWEPVGAAIDVAVGRNGLGWGRGLHRASDARPGSPGKHEGDGRAPAGVFRLTAAFGYGASEPTGLPYVPTDADVECVDDTTSAAYNTVRERTAGADWGSHEEMRRGDGLYRIGVVVAHNGPGVDGALVPGGGPAASPAGGSCIFLHVWRGPGSTTAGCTAMPDASLQDVLAWLDADAEPVLVQLPRAERDRLRPAWALP